MPSPEGSDGPAMADGNSILAAWPLHPAAPPPAAARLATRAALVSLVIGVVVWCMVFEGGLGFPLLEPKPGGAVTSDRLFNLHPVLMVTSLALFSEAILAWQKGVACGPPRARRKASHAALAAMGACCVALGATAAFSSHLLRVPPVPSLYSTHSWLGLLTLAALASAGGLGVWAFLSPHTAPPSPLLRAALVPPHRFAGGLAFSALAAAMATGLQEKQSFAIARPASGGPYSPESRLLVFLQLSLAAAAIGTAAQAAFPGRPGPASESVTGVSPPLQGQGVLEAPLLAGARAGEPADA